MSENHFLNCHSEESIKIRYRSLSKKWHPDKNKSPAAKSTFQEILRQRDEALRDVYRKLGLTDKEISAKIDDFLSSILETGKIKPSDDLVNSLADEFGASMGDKEPSFADVLKFVSGKILPNAKKKILGEDPKKDTDQKKLDK